MKSHVKTLGEEFFKLTGLIKSDADASLYVNSLEIVEAARAWYELEQPSAKRLCSAAKLGKGPAKKAARKGN